MKTHENCDGGRKHTGFRLAYGQSGIGLGVKSRCFVLRGSLVLVFWSARRRLLPILIRMNAK